MSFVVADILLASRCFRIYAEKILAWQHYRYSMNKVEKNPPELPKSLGKRRAKDLARPIACVCPFPRF